MKDFILSTTDISKNYGFIKAISKVNFNLRQGSIHAIVGGNGAGKTTFVKILYGETQCTSGELFIENVSRSFRTPNEAIKAGIGMVSQDFGLIDSMSIAENLSLNISSQSKKFCYRPSIAVADAEKILHQLNIKLAPTTLIANLSASQKQLVAIAKALTYNTSILIFDEPTSVLDSETFQHIKTLFRNLAENGKSIIYITHKLEEVFDLADNVSVFDNGHIIFESAIRETTPEAIVKLLNSNINISNSLINEPPVEHLKIIHNNQYNLIIKKGEAVGLRCENHYEALELARSIYGSSRRYSRNLQINGQPVKAKPSIGLNSKIGLVDEDRRINGLLKNLTVEENISFLNLDNSAIFGFISTEALRYAALRQIEDLSIKCISSKQPITELSGGNQQKVLLGRWFSYDFKILILIEPTSGVDIKSKKNIYSIIDRLKDKGQSFIIITTDQNELRLVCDRIIELEMKCN